MITLGEVKHGIEKLSDSARKERLHQWLQQELLTRFEGRFVEIDVQVMLSWGELMARLQQKGRTLPAMDSLIAATALHHNLIVVTRNERDFMGTGVSLFNPWEQDF